ncbi:hypothetical protein DFJ77DRAFT_442276 [Powellomyces hirtus]|nr:hypothetical protein DFJ77DRAFT_442276 [Powellomyces hirtus]
MDLDKEIMLNVAIREYLLFADYNTTLDTFTAESAAKGRPADQPPESTATNDHSTTTLASIHSAFLTAFRTGDRSAFFSLWDIHFPPSSLSSPDPVFHTLEFLLNIYFAIYLIHPSTTTTCPAPPSPTATTQSMDHFKQFLETRGSELCKTTQFLSYYALPYVPDPRTHPSFKDVFDEAWPAEMEGRVRVFLDGALKRVVKPRLVGWINEEPTAQLRSQLTAAHNDLASATHNANLLAARHRNLQSDYHNLITIASELVQTLTACINGETITPSYLAGVCHRLATFKQNPSRKSSTASTAALPLSLPSPSPSTNPITTTTTAGPTKPKPKPNPGRATPAPTPTPPTHRSSLSAAHAARAANRDAASERTGVEATGRGDPPQRARVGSNPSPTTTTNKLKERQKVLHHPTHPQLLDATRFDFDAIADDLRNSINTTTTTNPDTTTITTTTGPAHLLTALRRFATHRKHPRETRALITAYITHDLLRLKSDQPLLPHLLTPPTLPLLDLLTLLSSISPGRHYLHLHPHLIPTLLPHLTTHLPTHPLHTATLATLHNLSLHRPSQSTLIAHSTPTLLLTLLDQPHIADADTIPPTTTTLATATLMNLAQRTRGRKQLHADPMRTMRILTALLECRDLHVQTHVNGALYCLLADTPMREAARDVGLEELMRYGVEREEPLEKQVGFVLRRLENDTPSPPSSSSEDGSEDGSENGSENGSISPSSSPSSSPSTSRSSSRRGCRNPPTSTSSSDEFDHPTTTTTTAPVSATLTTRVDPATVLRKYVRAQSGGMVR